MKKTPYLKKSNHRNNIQHIIKNVNISLPGIWNSSEHSECQRTKKVWLNLMYCGTYNTCSFIISQVQLNSVHNSDPIFTSLSYLLVFFLRWTRVVISPVDFHSLSPIYFQQVFCAQCHCLRVVKTLHPIQLYEMYVVGSIDSACNSIYCACFRNTSTKNRVVLYVIISTMQNYTHFQWKTYNKIFIHIYFPLHGTQWLPLDSLY